MRASRLYREVSCSVSRRTSPAASTSLRVRRGIADLMHAHTALERDRDKLGYVVALAAVNEPDDHDDFVPLVMDGPIWRDRAEAGRGVAPPAHGRSSRAPAGPSGLRRSLVSLAEALATGVDELPAA
jgi:hypothetical protein